MPRNVGLHIPDALLRRVFEAVDGDGDGLISAAEFHELLSTLAPGELLRRTRAAVALAMGESVILRCR